MKSSKSCDCSGKSKCIVITIETCCKKDDKKGQRHKLRGEPSDKSVQRVASGPVVTEKTSSNVVSDEEGKKPSELKLEDQEPKDDVGDGKPKIHEEEPVPQRIFKLPIVSERHHGPGCAMEISILEKHEDSCLYKKEDVEGRHPIDDRAGSYDCIGRMVFRTCNSSEAESDSSKSAFHGGSAGEKNVVDILHPPKDEKAKEPSDKQLKDTPSHSKTSHSQSIHKKGSKSNKSIKSQKSKTAPPEEEIVKSKTVIPDQSMPPPRRDHERKHYPGDGCKLHRPRDPRFLAKYIEQDFTSSDVSPVYADIALQTETDGAENNFDSISTEEIVVSLTDVHKGVEKRKPTFLGAIFRRNYPPDNRK